MDETKDEYNNQQQPPEIKEDEDATISDTIMSDQHEQEPKEQSIREVTLIFSYVVS